MKWWGVLLLIMLICGVGAGSFFLGKYLTKPNVSTATKATDEAKDVTAPKDKDSKEKGDKKEEKLEKKEKVIAPTMPRLKRYLKPVQATDVFSQRYAAAHVKPHWNGQTAYGPPDNVQDIIFSPDVMLGDDVRAKKSIASTSRAVGRTIHQPKFQIEFGHFRYYRQAEKRMQDLTQKITDPLIICDILDKKGLVQYSLRVRRPMTKEEAHEYVGYCLEEADMVPRIVRYVF